MDVIFYNLRDIVPSAIRGSTAVLDGKIIPIRTIEPFRATSLSAMDAMMQMKKIDIATIEAAVKG